jgi:peptide/nickel transport system ATP-binding protein
VRLLEYATAERRQVLTEASLQVRAGEVVGVTGESGGGKSTLALALAGMLPRSAVVSARRWRLFDRQLVAEGRPRTPLQPAAAIKAYAGRQLFYISQDARSVLVPNRTIGWHLSAGLRQPSAAAAELLTQLHLRPAEEFLRRLPHELSTGQCQRVQLALAEALAHRALDRGEPFLLLADEPLASIDAALVQEFGDRLRALAAAGAGVLLISHQLQLLRRIAARGAVVHDGRVVEQGPTAEPLASDSAQAEPTRRLLAAERCTTYERRAATSDEAARPPATVSADHVLVAHDVSARLGGRWLPFPHLRLQAGERLGLHGPSGCGKTTFARVLLGVLPAERGAIHRFADHRWRNQPPPHHLPLLWQRLQFVPQDADLLFDPQGSLGESLAAAAQAFQPRLPYAAAWRTAGEILHRLHVPPHLLLAPPGRLSGGQRKRAAIARALAAVGWLQPLASSTPRVLVLDEPTVGIDQFLQAVLAETLLAAQRDAHLTLLVISHDRRFLDRFCTREIAFVNAAG